MLLNDGTRFCSQGRRPLVSVQHFYLREVEAGYAMPEAESAAAATQVTSTSTAEGFVRHYTVNIISHSLHPLSLAAETPINNHTTAASITVNLG